MGDEPTRSSRKARESAQKRKPGDYEIGYGKPPVLHRWVRGQSGNVAGRPRGHRSVETMIRKAFMAKIVVTENGISQKVPKFEVALKQLANKSASGDRQSTKLAWELMSAISSDDGEQLMHIIIEGGLPDPRLGPPSWLKESSDPDTDPS